MKRDFVFFLGTAFFFLPLALSSDPLPHPPAPAYYALTQPQNDIPGLKNFARVSPHLYRGAQPTVQGFLSLKKMGVKTVIDLRVLHSDQALIRQALQKIREEYSSPSSLKQKESPPPSIGTTSKKQALPPPSKEGQSPYREGFYYFHISFKPWHPEEEDLVPLLKVLQTKKYFPIFIHCEHGADRTGTAVALYRMVIQGWPRKEALKELPRFGFHKIWIDLKMFLQHVQSETWREKIKKISEPTLQWISLSKKKLGTTSAFGGIKLSH